MNSFIIILLLHSLSLFNFQHCVSDVSEIDKSGLLWPCPSFVPPWVLYPFSKIYSSPCLDSYISNMFLAPLNELTNITFSEIFDAYASNKCPMYLHGGLLRDVLEGDPSHDIDMSYPCDPVLALSICESLFHETEVLHNVSLCYTNPGGYLFIGRRKIDTGIEGKNWEEAFFHVENQEYTPNMLYYDMMNKVIIDMTTGVEDIMYHQIRIPVKPNLWDLWLFTANKSIGSLNTPFFQKWLILKKVCRYWKLRAKGYKDYDTNSRDYLIKKVDELWDSENYPIKDAFNQFICESFGGRFYLEICHLEGGFKGITDDKIVFCKKYMHELYMDLQGIKNGRVVRELNEMVAYTKCHQSHDYRGLGLFGERMGSGLIVIAVLGLMSFLFGGKF